MIAISPIRHYLTHTLIAVTLLSVLTACDKPSKTDDAPTNEPTISKNTISFPSNSSLKQSLTTAPAISSQENISNFPARITWDEDHTARISAPITGRLVDVLVQAGDHVKVNQALAYLSSPDMGSAQADVAKAKSV